MKKRVNARSKIKEKNARVCRVTVRASTAVIYGRENARSPPQSWNTPNSGEFSDSVVFTTESESDRRTHNRRPHIAQNRGKSNGIPRMASALTISPANSVVKTT